MGSISLRNFPFSDLNEINDFFHLFLKFRKKFAIFQKNRKKYIKQLKAHLKIKIYEVCFQVPGSNFLGFLVSPR